MGSTKKKSVRPASSPAKGSEPAGTENQVIHALSRSAVCRRVPLHILARLNRSILLRSSGRANLDALSARYDLQNKYGISPAALRSYAQRLEGLVRPVLAAHLITALLSCLPEKYRGQVVEGGESLLLSRLMRCLWNEESALTPAEMAKVTFVLTNVGRKGAAASSHPRSTRKAEAVPPPGENPSKLAEAVRAVYGLTWPPPDDPPSQRELSNASPSSASPSPAIAP